MCVPRPSLQVILAEELRKDPESFEGKCVRVLGKVAAINPRDNTAELTGGGVVVDLKLVGAVKVLPAATPRTVRSHPYSFGHLPCGRVGQLFRRIV